MDTVAFSTGVGSLLYLVESLQQTYSALRRFPREIAELSVEVGALREILLALLKLPLDHGEVDLNQTSGFYIALSSCRQTLMDIQSEVEHILGGNRQRLGNFVSLKMLLRANRVRVLKSELDRQKSTFSVLLSGLSMLSTRATTEGIEKLELRVAQLQDLSARQVFAYEEAMKIANERQRRSELLDWISTYDFRATHKQIAKRIVQGTGLWFLQSPVYVEWKNTPRSSLVVTGLAGCGKSTLCSTVIRILQQEDVLGLAYFFINPAERPSSGKVMSSLLRQLLEQTSIIPQHLWKVFESRLSPPLKDQDLLSAFWQALSDLHEGFVVIDGLNEMELTDRTDILNFLSKAEYHNLKWIVFSRPCAGLDPPKKHRTYAIDNQNHSDIHLLVRSRLDQSVPLKRNPGILHDLTGKITKKAAGNFLWVTLVLDQILRSKSMKNLRMAIEHLPEGLANYYELMWKDLNEETKIAISLVSLSPQPLNKFQIQQMVNEVRLGTNNLPSEGWHFEENGFITSIASDTVQLVHNSVRDWLKSNGVLSETYAKVLTHMLRTNLQITPKVEVSDKPADSEETQEYIPSMADLDETSSVVTYPSSVFTTHIEVSSQTSITSILSQLETVVQQFSRLFINHQAANPLIHEFLEKRGQDGFEASFASLLCDYSRGLKDMASSGAQQVAAIMVGEKANEIARQVVLMSDYLESSKVFTDMGPKEEQEGRAEMLNRFLHQMDESGTPKILQLEDEKGETERTTLIDPKEERGGQPKNHRKLRAPLSDSDLLRGEPEQDVYVNLERIKHWLTSSPPFEALLADLATLVHPPVMVPPIPPTRPDPPITPGYMRLKPRIFKAILKLIPGAERPLEEGMKRVRWTCVCRRKFYDDFYELKPGAVTVIQKALRRECTESSSVTSSEHGKRHFWAISFAISTFSSCLLAFIPIRASVTSVISLILCCVILVISVSVVLVFILIISCQENLRRPEVVTGSPSGGNPASEALGSNASIDDLPLETGGQTKIKSRETQTTRESESRSGRSRKVESYRRTSNSPSGSNSISSSSPSSDGESAARRRGLELSRNQLWILALFRNQQGEEIYVHLNARRRATDFTLFTGFQEKYYIVSSRWQRFSQLREVSSIRFVKFILADEKRGDVLQKDVWPPKHEPRIWLYEPYPAVENVPLVGNTYLMNLWRDVHHADRATYEEFKRTAPWKSRFIDWLRSAPHLAFQDLRKIIADLGDVKDLDDDWMDPSAVLASNTLPHSLHPTDVEQPTRQLRANRTVRSTPKIERKLRVIDNTYPEAWGLEFEETFHVHRVLFYILLLYALCSIGLLGWLIHRYGLGVPTSLSSVLWIIGWVATLLTLAITVWFRWAETYNV